MNINEHTEYCAFIMFFFNVWYFNNSMYFSKLNSKSIRLLNKTDDRKLQNVHLKNFEFNI